MLRMKGAWQIICLFIVLVSTFGTAWAARSPLGIGVAEQTINPAAPWAGFFLQIQAWQMQFERAIQMILVGMREDRQSALWLIGISFLYGILHAAGPGHGKAIISSYLVADHASLKRGVSLSFFSSILQALSAIGIIGAIFWLLPGKLTQTTHFIVTFSYILVMFVGIWLLVRHSLALFQRPKSAFEEIFDTSSFAPPSMTTMRGEAIAHIDNKAPPPIMARPHLAWRDKTETLALSNLVEHCPECGQMHMIDASQTREKLRLKTAFSLICATGLRPCNGALFVMSFALLNQLTWVGMMSVFAMALGTFITVSTLACLAVYAKKWALTLSSRGQRSPRRLKIIIEWSASFFIFLTGLLLLISALM